MRISDWSSDVCCSDLPLRAAGRDDLAAWNEQSPDFLEAENVHRVCYFAGKTGTAVNIVHLSSREALREVRRHRGDGRTAPIYVETCPHYLFLDDRSPAGTYAKVNPPVRSAADIDAMWEGVCDGAITTIGSDHVPRKRATKEKDIWAASNGFPDRKSDVKGKSVSVRVDRGGRRIIQKK